jgi:hypothetical protein
VLRRGRGDQGDPARLQEVVAEQLLDEVAGETVRALDDDGGAPLPRSRSSPLDGGTEVDHHLGTVESLRQVK